MCLVGVISYPGLSKTAHSSTMVTQHELRMASAEPLAMGMLCGSMIQKNGFLRFLLSFSVY